MLAAQLLLREETQKQRLRICYAERQPSYCSGPLWQQTQRFSVKAVCMARRVQHSHRLYDNEFERRWLASGAILSQSVSTAVCPTATFELYRHGLFVYRRARP